MTYTEHATVPAYVAPIWNDTHSTTLNRDEVRWSREGEAPPAIGDLIFATINGCGPAVVVAYFTESNWLGLKVRLLDPPKWFTEQNKGNVPAHVFGPEYRALTEEEHTKLKGWTKMPGEARVALADWKAEYGREWKAALEAAWLSYKHKGVHMGGKDAGVLRQIRNTYGPSLLKQL